MPFDVDVTEVRIGTILDDKPYDIPLGRYRLIFEAHPARTIDGVAYTHVMRLLFIAADEQAFAILKQGDLGSGEVLVPASWP